MLPKILLIILVLILSWINNLLVPLYLYHQEYGLFKRKYRGGGGCNGWSFVMDGLLAGLMNVVVTYYLLESEYSFSSEEIIIAFSLGVIATTISHITMSAQSWNIWIMPKPWKWNAAGYWHMVSMTLQIGYFMLVPIILFKNPATLYESLTIITLLLFGILLILFVYAFFEKDKGFVLGKFHINKEAW